MNKRIWNLILAIGPEVMLAISLFSFGRYIVFVGFCGGENLSAISDAQTIGAGALPPPLGYTYIRKLNILDLINIYDLEDLSLSILWLESILIAFIALANSQFYLFYFSVATLGLTLVMSRLEAKYICILNQTHKYAQALFEKSPRLNVIRQKYTSLNAVGQDQRGELTVTLLARGVFGISGENGEPTCNVYVLQASEQLGARAFNWPSWLRLQDATKYSVYANQLIFSVPTINKYKNDFFVSFSYFSSGNNPMSYYSVIACVPG